MALTINAKTFSADTYSPNSVGYVGPAHTMTSKDFVKLARTPASPTAVFSGVARTASKLTRTLTLTGALTPTHDAILTIDVSVPVGAASADIDALLNDMGSFLASASYKTHVKQQLIAY
jgi:hypothetical protein